MAAVLRTSHTAFVAKAGARVGARDARRVVPRRALVTPSPRTCRRASTVAGAGPSPCDLSDLSKLPGDPSLVLHTNVKMGDKKQDFMKAASKAVAGDASASPRTSSSSPCWTSRT